MEVEKMTNEENKGIQRPSALSFTKTDFARLVLTDMSKTRTGRGFLKKYKQSEVREFIENYKSEKNQVRLREISQMLFAKSPEYQRLLRYFSDMPLFTHIIAPIKDIKSLNKSKVTKQYTEVGELLKLMSLRHEMTKVLRVAFMEDVFYGYIHRDKKSFYIQQMDAVFCKISSVEETYNYSVDMSYFMRDEEILETYPLEIQVKYRQWKALKEKNPKISDYVELDAENTICIKVNEEFVEPFPPFAGSFDAIFDIEAFKDLRKDKEELQNYAILTQKLPIRTESENNNDFAIDQDTFMYFHNVLADIVPDNVGVATSPMEIEALKFDKDTVDRDGVDKATRDFWAGNGVPRALFGADTSTSAGIAQAIQTDEQIVFAVLTQIERWVNRYLKFEFKDLMFNAKILPVTKFNQDDMYKMYLEVSQYGIPVKSHLSAVVELDPIETMNMAYLENDLLKMHEEFKPLMSSHTMGADGLEGGNADKGKSGSLAEGRPKDKAKNVSPETERGRDKPNSTSK